MKKFEHIVKVCILIFSMLSINLPAWGNSVSSKNSSEDVKNGKVVLEGNHATFTFAASGKTISHNGINYTGFSVSKNNTLDCTFSWTYNPNPGVSIKVTNISVDVTGYTALAWETSSLRASFNGTTKNVGNLLGGMTNMSAANASGLSNNIVIKLTNKTGKTKDFFITNISITYTITPDAPTIKKSTETINVSLTNENQLDMTNLIGVSDVTDFMPVAFTSNSFSDPEGISSTGSYTFTGKYFYATKAGVYTFTNPYIAAKKDCHEKSATTTGKVTITVNRLNQTLTMRNDGQVNATTDKSNPTKLDLSTLCTQVGNGTVKYELVSAPNALDGTSAKNSCVINGKYFHAWVAGTYTLRASAPKTAQYNAATPQEFKVTVNRVTNTLAFYKSEDVRYVEQTVNSAVSTNSNATINTSTTDGSLAYYDAAQNKIFIPNSNNQSFDAKEVTLKVWQAETDVYTASAVKTLTLTVRKYNNVIIITGFDDAQHNIKTDWYDNELTLTADNTDYTHYPIYNEQIRGNEMMASFGQQEGTTDKWVVYTAQNTGLVEWRLWQNENYKYKASETTFVVNVINNPNCMCNLVDLSWKDDLFNNPPTVSTVGDGGVIDFNGIGDVLYFSLRSNLAAGNDMTYSLYTDDDWQDAVSKSSKSTTSYTNHTIALGEGEHNTTKVKFAKSHKQSWWGDDSDDPFINNIRVTRKRWMKILDGAGKSAKEITSLPKMERYIDDDAVHVTFYVDFSTCDKLVKVASNYGHVTFSNNLDRDTISENTAAITTRGYNDKVRVDLSYFSNQVEEEEVIITIYTEFENKKLTVPVKTVGYIFKGTESTEWNEPKNWNVGKVPAAINDVTIEAPTIVRTEQKVHSMDITTGSVTIAPTGGLTIGEGGIKGADADNFKLAAGKEGDTKGQTGFVRINPNSAVPMPQATVELYSIGYYNIESEEDNIAAWQYVGIPIETDALAKTFFKKCWVYNWDESIGNWRNTLSKLVMNPFEGYATTQDRIKEGNMITFAGQLFKGGVYQKKVTANGATDEKGFNLLANSFAAPIDIAQFSAEDFSEGVDPTIYLFNTGSRTDASQIVDIAEKAEAKGQYLPVPVKNVDAMKTAYHYPTVIAPMQGFCIKTEKEGTVTLNYERLVWNGNYYEHPNTPLRTPKKAVNLSTLGSLCVTVSANGWSDNLYMLESDSYDKAFEAGYDAAKMNSGEFNVFALEGESRLAVDATNNIIGTYVGVRTGEETTYTLSFSHLMTNNELFLLDKEANEIVDIYDGVEYTFYAEPNTEITDRFQILGREKAPEVTTAIEDAADNDGAKVHKFIKDNQLYILKNGVLYNATGARVH